MTVGTDQDFTHLSGLTFDSNELSPNYLESQLCTPQDRLEDIDFFPNFDDDLIRLTDVLLPEFESLTSFDDIDQCKQESGEDLCSIQDVESSYLDDNNADYIVEPSAGTALKVSSEYNKIENENTNSSDCSKVLLIKNKKTRTKRPRKENRNVMVPLFVPKFKSTKSKRRCIHCQAEETPQWRNGPTGRNTLCNACGLRYKSGRLVSDYRPAASPSFDSMKHSNFHRRIMQKKLCEEDNPGEVVNG